MNQETKIEKQTQSLLAVESNYLFSGFYFAHGSVFKDADGKRLVVEPLKLPNKIGGQMRMCCRKYGMRHNTEGSFDILWTPELDLACTFFSSNESGGVVFYPDWSDARTGILPYAENVQGHLTAPEQPHTKPNQ